LKKLSSRSLILPPRFDPVTPPLWPNSFHTILLPGLFVLAKLAKLGKRQSQTAASSPSRRSVRHLALPPDLMNSSSSTADTP
jgi:hypothetical protein